MNFDFSNGNGDNSRGYPNGGGMSNNLASTSSYPTHGLPANDFAAPGFPAQPTQQNYINGYPSHHPQQWGVAGANHNGHGHQNHQMGPPMHEQQHGFNMGWRDTSVPPAGPMGGMSQHGSVMGHIGMGSGLNSAPYGFPPQVYQEAMNLSKPVEQGDETMLIRTLVAAQQGHLNGQHRGGITHKEALNSLHGQRGHSASLWKDYYLDHKSRIDHLVASSLQRSGTPNTGPPMHIKKPQIPPIKAEHSIISIASASPTQVARRSGPPSNANVAGKKRRSSTPASEKGKESDLHGRNRRRTMNSLTVAEPTYDRHLPPPHADIKIPPKPTKEPSAPTKVIPAGRGNKFTEEDHTFFLDFIHWKLIHDADLSRTDLCDMLAEKAPHHSSTSWASYWSNHHDIPDKIYAAYNGEGEEEDEDEEEESDGSPEPRRKKTKYKETNTSESDGDTYTDEALPEFDFDETKMGSSGEPFSNTDLALAARHLASFRKDDVMTWANIWDMFAKRYPGRSGKAWAEYYRRTKTRMSKMAKLILRKYPEVENSRGQYKDAGPSRSTTKTASSKSPRKAKAGKIVYAETDDYDSDEDADGSSDIS